MNLRIGIFSMAAALLSGCAGAEAPAGSDGGDNAANPAPADDAPYDNSYGYQSPGDDSGYPSTGSDASPSTAPDASTPSTFDANPPPPSSDSGAPPPSFDGGFPPPSFDGGLPPPPGFDAGAGACDPTNMKYIDEYIQAEQSGQVSPCPCAAGQCCFNDLGCVGL